MHTTPVCLLLRPYSPQWLQASRSLLVLLKPHCLAEEGAIDLAVFQESCSRPSRCGDWGCSGPGPQAGLRYLIVPEQSPYHLIFSMPSTVLDSNPHIRWDSIGCSLCSSEDQLGIPPMHKVKWTLFPPISLPSSESHSHILEIWNRRYNNRKFENQVIFSKYFDIVHLAANNTTLGRTGIQKQE